MGLMSMLTNPRWFVAVSVIIALLATACGSGDNDGGGADGAQSGTPSTVASLSDAGVQVVATTTIIADMAREIAGDRAAVVSLLPVNADPHDFEATPRDVEAVADADLVLEHGLSLDSWTEGLVDESGTEAPVVTVTDGIDLIAGSNSDEEGMQADDDRENMDPHVWFDVRRAKVMVDNIRDALIDVDPDGREAYEANTATYQAELDELHGWIQEQIATIPEENRKMVTTHDAFGYYVDTYGLELVGTVIPSLDSQAQPSAGETSALIDAIQEQNVRAIFVEAALNPELAEQIASEAGVEIVDTLYGDALAPEGSGAETYIGLMRTDTEIIVEALTGE